MDKLSLDNVKEIKIEDGYEKGLIRTITYITYNDNTTHIIKGDVHLVKGLSNTNTDGPIIDHCI
jgi:hypothetical protein